ncbi:MAG: hypothetical protein IPL61_18960 [Myxococcales bacterium]|nr:hypothetical protein [Myxococcales bacterium]
MDEVIVTPRAHAWRGTRITWCMRRNDARRAITRADRRRDDARASAIAARAVAVPRMPRAAIDATPIGAGQAACVGRPTSVSAGRGRKSGSTT